MTAASIGSLRSHCRNRSFSRAARELGLTQPSASRAVAALESRLDERDLFDAHAAARRHRSGQFALAGRVPVPRAQLPAGPGPRHQRRLQPIVRRYPNGTSTFAHSRRPESLLIAMLVVEFGGFVQLGSGAGPWSQRCSGAKGASAGAGVTSLRKLYSLPPRVTDNSPMCNLYSSTKGQGARLRHRRLGPDRELQNGCDDGASDPHVTPAS
jgi:hypothetical protein